MKSFYLQNSKCPICGSSKNTSLGPVYYSPKATIASRLLPKFPQTPILLQCSECKFGFLSISFTTKFLDECYSQNTQPLWRSKESSYKCRKYRIREKLLKRYAPNSKVLDIGCFDCGWLSSLDSSWERYGIEPAGIGPFPVGITISNTTLEESSFKENFFGAVTLFDVVKHLLNPRDIFEKIYRCLAPGGIVIVETGDIMSYFAKIMKNRWSYAAIPAHVSFFTYQSIKKVFSLLNIELIYYKKIHRQTSRSKFSRKLIQAIKALGYRAFSGGIEAFPATKKVEVIKCFYEHKPPDFLFRDHFIAVGRKE